MNPVFPGKVADGKLLLDLTSDFRKYVKTLEGKRVEVVVRPLRSQRSLEANSYYWAVVVPLIAEFCGYTKDEMHDALAMKFLRIEDCPITGAPRRKRTPDCDTAEFAAYVDACIRLAAEHGVYIPAPHEVEVVKVTP